MIEHVCGRFLRVWSLFTGNPPLVSVVYTSGKAHTVQPRCSGPNGDSGGWR